MSNESFGDRHHTNENIPRTTADNRNLPSHGERRGTVIVSRGGNGGPWAWTHLQKHVTVRIPENHGGHGRRL